MSYRSFWVRRFIQSGGYLPGAIPPLFDISPFIKSCFIGQTLELITGTIATGSPSPTITTEVVNLAGTVLPANYVIQQGDQLRFKQTATNASGSDIRYSGWAFAVPKITGYTDLTPVVRSTGVVLTASSQPGSRLHYISTSGGYDPALADYYFWDGTQLIDSSGSTTGVGGVAYGTDWRNPTGPIKPFRHMSACFTTNNGLNPGIRSGSPSLTGAGLESSGTNRYQKPDRWLFKRGDTFNLDTDLPDYKTFATSFTATTLAMGLPGGADATNVQAMCDYGPSSSARPRIIYPKNKGGATKTNTAWSIIPGAGKHVRWVGLHFDGHTRDADFTGYLQLATFVNYTSDKINQGFEDLRVDGMGGGDTTAASGSSGGKNQTYFYRCTFTDAWAGALNYGHLSAAHSAAEDPGRVQFVDCRIARNGYKFINPGRVEGGQETPSAHNSSTIYPIDSVVLSGGEWYVCNQTTTSGIAITNTSYWTKVSSDGARRALGTVFDRNLYFAGRSDMYDTVVLRGASNEQFRFGGFIQNNFFQTGSLVISDWFAKSEDEVQTAAILNNVIQNVNQSGVHTAVPIAFNMGVKFSLVAYNLCTGAAEEVNGTGFFMASRSVPLNETTVIYNRTRGNVVRNNLLSAGTGTLYAYYDGINTGNPDTAIAVWPSLTGNKVLNNDAICTTSSTPVYTPLPNPATTLAPLTTDTITLGTTMYSSRANYASFKGASAPERTLKTYLQSLGVTVSSFDGVHEMVSIFNAMDRNNWPSQYSAAAINNYIRTGLGFTVPA